MFKDNKKLVAETIFIKEALKEQLSLNEFLLLLYFDNSFDLVFDIKVIAKTDESVSVAGSNSNIEIYQSLNDTEYTFEYVESEFVFEFSLDTISSSGMYYIEFEHESTKYAYLLTLANTSDKIEITKIEDISEIIYNV